MLNDRFKDLFPAVFDVIGSKTYLGGRLSPWLICSKQAGHGKGVLVFSDDSHLPNAMDIIAACQHGKARTNFNDGILFLGESICYNIHIYIINFGK